jgi:hypothetical protein
MKRPGAAGMTIVLAFTIVAAIEVRTLLGMFGIDLSTQLYYAVAAAIVVGVLLALFALPKNETANVQNT